MPRRRQRSNLVGGNTQGTLTPGNSTQLFQFNGTAGTRLFFNWQTGAYPSYYQLFDAGNSYLFSTYFGTQEDFTLPADGPYTLVLYGNNAKRRSPTSSMSTRRRRRLTTLLTRSAKRLAATWRPQDRSTPTRSAAVPDNVYSSTV